MGEELNLIDDIEEYQTVENHDDSICFVHTAHGHLSREDTDLSYMTMSKAVELAKWILNLPQNKENTDWSRIYNKEGLI